MVKYTLSRHVVFFLIFVLSISSSVYILFNGSVQGYGNTVYMPLLYLICFFLLYRGRISKEKPVFFLVFLFVGLVRYVFFPFLISFNGDFYQRSVYPPAFSSIDKAIFLMCYELAAVTGVIFFVEKKKRGRSRLVLSCKKISYSYSFVVFFISLFLCFLLGGYKLISFLKPNILSDIVGSISTFNSFSAYFFIVSKQIFFVSSLFYFYERYNKSKNKFFLFFSLFLVALNSFVYFGTNRTDILITTLISLMFFYRLFGKEGLSYSLIVVLLSFFVLMGVTKEREYQHHSNTIDNVIDYAQGYAGGVYNVAIGVEVEKWYPEASSLQGLLFDFVRPMIGLNVFVSNLDLKYSNIYFNDRMWANVDRRSQIMPMIAQGYLYFGLIFSPLISLFFVIFYYFLEGVFYKSRYLEVQYFLLLSMARMGLLFGQNSMNLINNISFNLVLLSFIFIFYRFLVRSSRY